MIDVRKLNFEDLDSKNLEDLLFMFQDSYKEDDFMASGEIGSIDSLNKILKNENLIHFIAYENMVPVGYSQVIYKSNSNNFFTGAKINALAVIPKKRRQGIASSLIDFTIQNLKENKNIINVYLDVIKDNNPAIKLYEKFNFIKVGELKSLFTKNNKRYDVLTYSLFSA